MSSTFINLLRRRLWSIHTPACSFMLFAYITYAVPRSMDTAAVCQLGFYTDNQENFWARGIMSAGLRTSLITKRRHVDSIQRRQWSFGWSSDTVGDFFSPGLLTPFAIPLFKFHYFSRNIADVTPQWNWLLYQIYTARENVKAVNPRTPDEPDWLFFSLFHFSF